MIHLVLSALLAASHAFGANESAPNCQFEVTAKGSHAASIAARAEERAGVPVKVVYSIDPPPPSKKSDVTIELMREGGGLLAELNITLRGSTMQITKLEVMPAFRRIGISELLMLHALSHNPEVERIETVLLETNWDVMQAALERGKSCIEAMKTTPSWHMRERLGFTVMKEADCFILPSYVAERP